jgi:hypothetical protein
VPLDTGGAIAGSALLDMGVGCASARAGAEGAGATGLDSGGAEACVVCGAGVAGFTVASSLTEVFTSSADGAGSGSNGTVNSLSSAP